MLPQHIFASILIFVTLMGLNVQASANGAGVTGETSIDLAEIDKRATQLMKHLEMVGLSVAIVEDGEMTFSKGYGEVQRNSKTKVSADTVFRWASVSKGVAAATVLSARRRSF